MSKYLFLFVFLFSHLSFATSYTDGTSGCGNDQWVQLFSASGESIGCRLKTDVCSSVVPPPDICNARCPDGSVAPSGILSLCPKPPPDCSSGLYSVSSDIYSSCLGSCTSFPSFLFGMAVLNCPADGGLPKCDDGSVAPDGDVSKCPPSAPKLCPNGSVAPNGDLSLCPKCTNGTYKQAGNTCVSPDITFTPPPVGGTTGTTGDSDDALEDLLLKQSIDGLKGSMDSLKGAIDSLKDLFNGGLVAPSTGDNPPDLMQSLQTDNPYNQSLPSWFPKLPETTCSYEIHEIIFGRHFDLSPCTKLQPLRAVLAWVFSLLTIWTCFRVVFKAPASSV